MMINAAYKGVMNNAKEPAVALPIFILGTRTNWLTAELSKLTGAGIGVFTLSLQFDAFQSKFFFLIHYQLIGFTMIAHL